MVAAILSLRSRNEDVSGVSSRGEEEIEQDIEVGEQEDEEWMMLWD